MANSLVKGIRWLVLKDIGRRAALGQRVMLVRNENDIDGEDPPWDLVLPQKFGVDGICAVCEGPFVGKRSTRIYCSEKCRDAAAYRRRK